LEYAHGWASSSVQFCFSDIAASCSYSFANTSAKFFGADFFCAWRSGIVVGVWNDVHARSDGIELGCVAGFCHDTLGIQHTAVESTNATANPFEPFESAIHARPPNKFANVPTKSAEPAG
jgi:hypothetical protein